MRWREASQFCGCLPYSRRDFGGYTGDVLLLGDPCRVPNAAFAWMQIGSALAINAERVRGVDAVDEPLGVEFAVDPVGVGVVDAVDPPQPDAASVMVVASASPISRVFIIAKPSSTE